MPVRRPAAVTARPTDRKKYGRLSFGFPDDLETDQTCVFPKEIAPIRSCSMLVLALNEVMLLGWLLALNAVMLYVGSAS